MSNKAEDNVDMVEHIQNQNGLHEKEDHSLPAQTPVENLAEVGKPPDPWGKGARKLYMMCALLYLCSTMNGTARCLTFLS
jgi:hypothetical protein